MASIPVTLDGVLYDLHNKTTQRVVLIGEASLSGLSVGGGPVIPPEKPPTDEKPPGIWGPGDPRPTPPIANVPGLPPTIDPPPSGTPDDDGFIKPPPAGGGWAFHETFKWGYYPKPGEAGPK